MKVGDPRRRLGWSGTPWFAFLRCQQTRMLSDQVRDERPDRARQLGYRRSMATMDDADSSRTFRRLADELEAYLDAQHPVVGELRHRSMPDPPRPDDQNPMLAYVLGRASEIAESDGVQAAVVWASVHGWFEGVLSERDRTLRHATGADR